MTKQYDGRKPYTRETIKGDSLIKLWVKYDLGELYLPPALVRKAHILMQLRSGVPDLVSYYSYIALIEEGYIEQVGETEFQAEAVKEVEEILKRE